MVSPSWDPAQYQRYAGERARPYLDLIGRVHTPSPACVVDLGCGPGPMTALLSERWPTAEVTGVDSSAEMISAAAQHARRGRLRFVVGSIEDWEPQPIDVIVSNAALQWVPGHIDLLPRWAAALRPGGALAFQMPRSTGVAAGEIFRSVATSARWAAVLGDAAAGTGPRSAASPVRPIAEYVDVLAGLGLSVDAWETTYQHVLGGPDPVLDWFSGTGLRPYLDALASDQRSLAEFRAEVGARLREAYPPAPYGTILPFPRIFVVAHRE
jgi:trans-aconitate 2-methyltransferase